MTTKRLPPPLPVRITNRCGLRRSSQEPSTWWWSPPQWRPATRRPKSARSRKLAKGEWGWLQIVPFMSPRDDDSGRRCQECARALGPGACRGAIGSARGLRPPVSSPPGWMFRADPSRTVPAGHSAGMGRSVGRFLPIHGGASLCLLVVRVRFSGHGSQRQRPESWAWFLKK